MDPAKLAAAKEFVCYIGSSASKLRPSDSGASPGQALNFVGRSRIADLSGCSEAKIVEQTLWEGWLVAGDIPVSPIQSGKPSAREKKLAQALRHI